LGSLQYSNQPLAANSHIYAGFLKLPQDNVHNPQLTHNHYVDGTAAFSNLIKYRDESWNAYATDDSLPINRQECVTFIAVADGVLARSLASACWQTWTRLSQDLLKELA